MELEILGMNFGCVLSALSDAKIPEKECLLPLVSKLLGYCIVAASTTVKLPQSMIPVCHMLCSVTTNGAFHSWPVDRKTCSTAPIALILKLSRQPSSLMACCVRKPSTGTRLLPGFRILENLEMSNGRILASGTPLKIFGMDIGYIWSALLDATIPSRDSLLPFLSTVLGYFIIAGSIVTKLPQILKILKHGSVRGLSVASFELELIGYTIALAYCIHKGLPFSAYGELAFLLIQAPTVLAGKIDPGLFEILYASQHAIFFCARVPQIWKNFTNKSTGELSFLTSFMNFAGSLVRVFTSIQEKTPLSGIL
uniref:Mannose-P-dolichol utilization defect 1 protein homolog n=1 Tax=Aegilops tauschii TaxID=37682 RepID=M8C1K2_AEGTA